MKKKLNWKQRAAALSAFALIAASQTKAAVPAGYTDAVDDMVTDALSFITAVFLALAGLAAVSALGSIMLKGVKKAKGAV